MEIQASASAARASAPIAPRTEPLALPASPKILLYSHDTFGLGNIRRSLLLGELLGSAYPRSAILLVTGSPMIHEFRIPSRLDYVKLPCVNRVRAEEYEPRFLTDCGDEVRRTRRAIIERTSIAFAPDLVIVDKRAAGIDGELVPALEALRRLPSPPRVVLGLRDILDAPDVTRRALRDNGSFKLIERYYDEVWIYGSRDVFDAVAEYGFPPAVAALSHFCGYLRRHSTRRTTHTGAPRVLVTGGGGGDAVPLVTSYLTGLADVGPGDFQSVVVLGPQLAPGDAARLRGLGADRPDVEFVEFESDMTRRYEEADVVLSMAGYNTVCELLTAGVRAVLVPRAEPVQEQLIRARRLAAQGHFRMIEPAELTPAHLIAEARAELAASQPAAAARIDMEGLTRIRSRVHRLLERRKP
jgi:predicted glycosyltransferase